MAPKKTSTEGSEQPQSLTEGELRFIKAIFDNMTQKPDANWENVAQVLSLKDAKCAKERWRQMSVRHGWREGASGGGNGNGGPSKAVAGTGKVTKKPRTPRKKAKKSDSEDESKTEIKSEENEDVKLSQEEI